MVAALLTLNLHENGVGVSVMGFWEGSIAGMRKGARSWDVFVL